MKIMANILGIIVALVFVLNLSSAAIRTTPLTAEDIEFWDIDNTKGISESEKTSIKENIVQQLSVEWDEDEDPTKGCACPKIFGPVICDNLGNSHTNICLFLCKKRVQQDLTPKKVLITLEAGNVKDRCKL